MTIWRPGRALRSQAAGRKSAQMSRNYLWFAEVGMGDSLKRFMTNRERSADPISQDHQDQAALAYSIIEALLNHTRVVSDLIALMAQAHDQDTTKALIQTPQWQAYLESRRRMETTRGEVEKF